jgi:hypothetical protein
MKKIKRNELFRSVSAFLAGKGIELKDGSLTGRIRQGCDLLTETVNLAQGGLAKAKAEVGAKVDQIRQVVHEKTAPKTPSPAPASAAKPPRAAGKRAKPTGKPVAKRKPGKPTAGGNPKPAAN